jgi:hypothetical protein
MRFASTARAAALTGRDRHLRAVPLGRDQRGELLGGAPQRLRQLVERITRHEDAAVRIRLADLLGDLLVQVLRQHEVALRLGLLRHAGEPADADGAVCGGLLCTLLEKGLACRLVELAPARGDPRTLRRIVLLDLLTRDHEAVRFLDSVSDGLRAVEARKPLHDEDFDRIDELRHQPRSVNRRSR